MLKRYISIIIVGLMLSACAGEESVKVTSLQKKDKNLSCREIRLEINEAEHYRKTAERNKNPKVKSLLMPLGYISTYVNAEEASGAANARIDYLNRIYDILDCDNNPAQVKEQRYPAYNYQSYQSFDRGYGVNNADYSSTNFYQN